MECIIDHVWQTFSGSIKTQEISIVCLCVCVGVGVFTKREKWEHAYTSCQMGTWNDNCGLARCSHLFSVVTDF